MRLVFFILMLCLPAGLAAQTDALRLSAPQALQDSGLLQHLLPRYALKHRQRVTPVGPDEGAELVLGDAGTPVFHGLDQTWRLSHDGTEAAQRFADWLLSDIGKRTIEGFAPGGQAVFTAAVAKEIVAAPVLLDGNATRGAELSLTHCGRCHVVSPETRMTGMGATPSFALMRTFKDWQNRFATFYVLNPHPSFTQVTDITPPFDPARPPPIVPITVTETNIDDILAYVATIDPADLGAPLQFQ